MLTGCVSAGQVGTDIWHALTPAERAEADVLEQAMAKLAALCREQNPGGPCVPPAGVVTWSDTTPHYGPGHLISVPRLALDPRLRAVMAHELAHAWFADARTACQAGWKAVVCERNANLHGIQILVAGYGYDASTAGSMMWASLVTAVQQGVKPSPGHPDPCAELHDYERRAGASALYACTERTAGAAR